MSGYLLVVDMQDDYIGSNRNIKKYSYDVDCLIEKVNSRIQQYPKEKVIYILNQFIWEKKSIVKNFYKDLIIVSNNIFTKRRQNAFSNKELVKFMKDKKNDGSEIEIIGVDGNYCIKSTVLGAIRLGYKVNICENAVGVLDKKRYAKTLDRLKKNGTNIYNNS